MSADAAPESLAFGRLFRIDGRVAVVTGGGGGFGASMARILAEAGATVCLVDNNEDRVTRQAKMLAVAGHSVSAYPVDVSIDVDVASLARRVSKKIGRIDILVNNAGISPPSQKIEEIAYEDWKRVIDINLGSVFLCTKHFLPHLIDAGQASIVNIASILGLVAFPDGLLFQAAYAASKAGIIGLTKQTAAEYGANNVRCNAIAPGWHLGTGLGDDAGTFPTVADRTRRDMRIAEHTSLRRAGSADEIAGLVLYLASDASSFATGSVFVHDGGWTAQ